MPKKLFKLTQDQQQKLDTLKWLISDHHNDRETGRTTLLAMAFIEKAITNPGLWVRLFDHHIGGATNTILMSMRIESLIPEELKPAFKISNNSIMFSHDPIS